jgi:hypothetical protein
MIQKIADWVYRNYRIQVPKRDIWMALIIVVGLIILALSLINYF